MDQRVQSSEEIDLKQLSAYFEKGFKSFLRGIIQVISFYKKRWKLILSLLIFGLIIGYALDYFIKNNKNYIQEVIIAPKYNSTAFIYNIIDQINDSQDSEDLIKTFKLNEEELKSLREIQVKPIINLDDLLSFYAVEFDQNDYYKTLEETSFEDLGKLEYRSLYKQHIIQFEFKNNIYSEQIIDKIFDFIRSNSFYENQKNIGLNQIQLAIKESEKTLSFIESYLDFTNKERSEDLSTAFMVGNVEKSMSVASVLEKKEELIEFLNQKREELKTGKAIFEVVTKGSVRKHILPAGQRYLFIVPITLFLLASGFYFLQYVGSSAYQYAYRK